jgi:hypothetical protein
VAGFSFDAKDRCWPTPALQNYDFQQFKGPLYLNTVEKLFLMLCEPDFRK